nr:LysR family transcriptional regulator [Brevibacillus dissolubilis]
MNLDWFRAFLETASTKSPMKASEKLHITHPALTKQIQKLERELVVTLLKRSSASQLNATCVSKW